MTIVLKDASASRFLIPRRGKRAKIQVRIGRCTSSRVVREVGHATAVSSIDTIFALSFRLGVIKCAIKVGNVV